MLERARWLAVLVCTVLSVTDKTKELELYSTRKEQFFSSTSACCELIVSAVGALLHRVGEAEGFWILHSPKHTEEGWEASVQYLVEGNWNSSTGTLYFLLMKE